MKTGVYFLITNVDFHEYFSFFRYVHGCLQSCGDADGCNAASLITSHQWVIYFLVAFLLILELVANES